MEGVTARITAKLQCRNLTNDVSIICTKKAETFLAFLLFLCLYESE